MYPVTILDGKKANMLRNMPASFRIRIDSSSPKQLIKMDETKTIQRLFLTEYFKHANVFSLKGTLFENMKVTP